MKIWFKFLGDVMKFINLHFFELFNSSAVFYEEAIYIIDYNFVRYSFEVKYHESSKFILFMKNDSKFIPSLELDNFTTISYISSCSLINSSNNIEHNEDIISGIVQLLVNKLGYKQCECYCYGYRENYYWAVFFANILKCNVLSYDPLINDNDKDKFIKIINNKHLPYTLLYVNNYNKEYSSENFLYVLSILFQNNFDIPRIRIFFTDLEMNNLAFRCLA